VPELGGKVSAEITAKVANRHSLLGFIIAHPYGALGGNLHNNVVSALTAYLGSLGESHHHLKLAQVINHEPPKSLSCGVIRSFVPSAGRGLQDRCTPMPECPKRHDHPHAKALLPTASGFTTCRFNFRGFGGSTGRPTWRGGGERDDMLAVCKHMLNLSPSPPTHLILIGYSYGSIIASSVGGALPEVSRPSWVTPQCSSASPCRDSSSVSPPPSFTRKGGSCVASLDSHRAVIGRQVMGYAALSYPFSVSWALTLFQASRYLDTARVDKPKLLLMGDSDNFTSLASFEASVRNFPSPKEVVVVKVRDGS
jgi:alpha/beta superfamily hydrolase